MSAYETFSSFFGATAQVILIVWGLLSTNDLICGGSLEHLLWACMLMKQYMGDRVSSKLAGADVKTFRKWSWHMISAMSWLEAEVVSVIKCFINILFSFIYKYIKYMFLIFIRLLGKTGRSNVNKSLFYEC